MERPPGFTYRSDLKRQSRLCCEQLPVERLAERFGTPLYVYSARAIRERVRAFDHAFKDIEHTICYSVKANSNLAVLRLLGELGCGFDVVSGGELARVLAVRRAEKVVFSGVGKAAQEMEAAVRAKILLFNVESASELRVLEACAARLKSTASVALRVNPDVPADTHPYISTGLEKHKFGVPVCEARELYARAARSPHLRVAGISVHIGSQITNPTPFSAASQRVAEIVGELRRDGHTILYVDVGGGLGIPYQQQREEFSHLVRAYAEAVIAPLQGLGVKLLVEPGRSIVGPAGALLTRVLYRKANGGKKFIVVDAAMNDLIRPALYQAEHEIVPVEMARRAPEIVDIVGPVCESGDFFARARSLPAVAEGELLAILDAGAYGMALASNYNSRARPAEVMVEGKTAKLIRRRETIAELIRLERAN
ncbi:MAG: diaminopimelate decarboxylase [Acidobacteria bacterium]|nr:diaminopimelate decarboxylase [Acidobacteriota bacterium]